MPDGPSAEARTAAETRARTAREPGDGPAPEPLLSARRFLPLFLVQALGAFNDNVFKNAFVALLTFRLADQLETPLTQLVAIAAGLFIVPFAIFAPYAGKIADQIDKALMMRWVKLAEIGLMVVAAVAYQIQNITLLYVLLFLMGAQSAFFAPIKYGVLPQYLRPEELVRGNGLVQAGTFFAILLGTIVGTNLVLTEQGVLLTSVAVVLIAVAGWLASRAAPPAPPSTHGPDPNALPFAWAPYEVLRVTMREPVVFRTVLSISWFWFVGATYLAALPALTKEQLGGDETVLTLLLAAFSIGVAIGSVLCAKLYRGAIKVGGYAPLAALGIAVFSLDVMWAAGGSPAIGDAYRNVSDFLSSVQGWRILIDFVALAMCAGVYLTPLNAVYQSNAPAAERGRVVACSNMIDSVAMAISAVAIIVLGGFGLSTGAILGLIGGTGLAAALVVARWAPETRLGQFALRVVPPRPARR